MLSLVSLGRLASGERSGAALEWTRLLIVAPFAALRWHLHGGAIALALIGAWAACGRRWYVDDGATTRKKQVD